jgi:molybdopterin converting factor subunit 1
MQLKVLFFATLKDRAGQSQTTLTVPDGASVAALREALASALPGLAPALPTALVSVNHEYAFNEDTLKDGDEIALFPPVSGGVSDC